MSNINNQYIVNKQYFVRQGGNPLNPRDLEEISTEFYKGIPIDGLIYSIRVIVFVDKEAFHTVLRPTTITSMNGRTIRRKVKVQRPSKKNYRISFDFFGQYFEFYLNRNGAAKFWKEINHMILKILDIRFIPNLEAPPFISRL